MVFTVNPQGCGFSKKDGPFNGVGLVFITHTYCINREKMPRCTIKTKQKGIKMAVQLDTEKTKKNIAFILDHMKTDADPVLLGEYRKLFKKEVSLFRRSWAAAWLLMKFEQGGRPGKNSSPRYGESRFRQEARNNGGETNGDDQRFPPLPEEESKRLFISIGRNRRVFPREILGLILGKTNLSREDIGSIRILDNYSFVQVRDSTAEQIIKTLNGVMFRGRTLAVNYAKSKKDEALPENQGTETAFQSEQPDEGDDEENI
jgi:hypothetical protein